MSRMTDFLIITSTEDKASMNIRDVFLNDNLLKFRELDKQWHDYPLMQLEMISAKKDHSPFFQNNSIYLGLTDSPLIFLDDLKLRQSDLNPEFLIFASRHRSKAGKPAFLTHSTGNWNEGAKYGGNPRELSKTSALLLKVAFNNLLTQRNIKKMNDFVVDLEVSHHGPTTLEKPLIFMELGSSEEEWEIKKGGEVVAHAILSTCIDYTEWLKNKIPTIGIGFGGTHYAPQFRKLINDKDIAVS
ncbi:MAG: hypothetical protein EU548_04410, partial [Promethearchaeota archaeon]